MPMLLLSVFGLIKVSNKGSDCKKWLFLKSSNQRVYDVAGAIKVLSPVLKTENKYKDYDLPSDPDGFLRKYNIRAVKRM